MSVLISSFIFASPAFPRLWLLLVLGRSIYLSIFEIFPSFTGHGTTEPHHAIQHHEKPHHDTSPREINAWPTGERRGT